MTLFRGFPFPPGVSVVEQIDPLTGNHSPFITGLRTAIDVLPLEGHYLVLQHTSGTNILPPFITAPGLVLDFATPAGPPTVVTNCLTRPTSMTFDEKTGLLYVTQYNGRVVEVAGASPASSAQPLRGQPQAGLSVIRVVGENRNHGFRPLPHYRATHAADSFKEAFLKL